MKKILFFIAISALFTSSCFDECTFRTCGAADFNVPNSLVFIFDFDAAYTPDDIENAHIIKYTKNGAFNQALDTFYFTEQFNTSDYLMVLSDPKPFSSGGTINIHSYEDFDYIIKPNTNGINYKLTDIKVKGEFSDCDCIYTNTKKMFKLDNAEVNRTGSNMQVVLD